MVFLAEDDQACLLPECLCNVWLSLLPFILGFERSWKPHHDSSGATPGLSLRVFTVADRKEDQKGKWEENKPTGVESMALAEALGFLSVISKHQTSRVSSSNKAAALFGGKNAISHNERNYWELGLAKDFVINNISHCDLRHTRYMNIHCHSVING